MNAARQHATPLYDALMDNPKPPAISSTRRSGDGNRDTPIARSRVRTPARLSKTSRASSPFSSVGLMPCRMRRSPRYRWHHNRMPPRLFRGRHQTASADWHAPGELHDRRPIARTRQERIRMLLAHVDRGVRPFTGIHFSRKKDIAILCSATSGYSASLLPLANFTSSSRIRWTSYATKPSCPFSACLQSVLRKSCRITPCECSGPSRA